MKDVLKKLGRFCYRPRRDDTPRPYIQAPWRAAGWWYATNGKWLVRVPVEDGDPPAPVTEYNPPDAPEIIRLYGFDNLPVVARLNRRALTMMLSRVSLMAREEDNYKTLLGFAPGRVAMFSGNDEEGYAQDCWVAPEDTKAATAAVNGQYLKKLLVGWWTPRDTVVVKVKQQDDGFSILQLVNPRTKIEIILVGLASKWEPIDFTPVKAALEGVPEEDARPVVKAAKAAKRAKPRKPAKPAVEKNENQKPRVETRKEVAMEKEKKDTNKAQAPGLQKWDLVEYTSRRGNTARYWVVWVGKNRKGTPRVKLVHKGGHPFFVDASKVKLVEKARERKQKAS